MIARRRGDLRAHSCWRPSPSAAAPPAPTATEDDGCRAGAVDLEWMMPSRSLLFGQSQPASGERTGDLRCVGTRRLRSFDRYLVAVLNLACQMVL